MLGLGPGVLLEHVLGGDLALELPDKLLVCVVRDPLVQIQVISPLIKLVSEKYLNRTKENKDNEILNLLMTSLKTSSSFPRLMMYFVLSQAALGAMSPVS